MPGVPSGRGCDGCRAQKKKCDVSRFPCPRCTRLGIPCIGLGQQRFLFRNERKKLVSEHAVAPEPCRDLSNALTRLTSAFVERVNPMANIRVQLLFNFGGYLGQVPRRLGSNEALDAAADTLVTAHAHFCAGYFSPGVELLAKYTRALNILRHYLGDPVKAHSSETLCAIMILMICQMLGNFDAGRSFTHTEGAARILKNRGYLGPRDEFEQHLLLALRGSVVVEALYSDKINFTRQEWKDLVENELDGTAVDGKLMRCLARVPHLMQRGREALRSGSVTQVDMLDLKNEASSLRKECQDIVTLLHERLSASNASADNCKSLEVATLIHALHSRAYAMGLSTGIMLNCILGALEDNSSYLSDESKQFSDGIIQLAKTTIVYLPLGGAYMFVCLIIAWAGASDENTKSTIKALLSDYERSYSGSIVPDRTTALIWTANRFALKESSFSNEASNPWS